METVRSKRLTLIPCGIDVAEAALIDRSKAEALLGVAFHPKWPGVDTKDFFPFYIRLLRQNPDFLPWGVWLMVKESVFGRQEERRVIGDLGFKGPPDEKGAIDIGYAVVSEERGKGYATEAVRALIDWAFGKPVVKVVTADCEDSNHASAAVLTEAGLKRDGRRQRLLHWKMTRRDWERSRPGGPLAPHPRMYYVEQGSGLPVILLHGLACSSSQWMYTVPALAKEGYRAIAVDLPGFGRSAMPKREITTADYTREVLRFMDELGLAEAALVGNSMGGFVAWHTAAVSPERVRAIVLADPAGAPPSAVRSGQGLDVHLARASRDDARRLPFGRGIGRRFFTNRAFRYLVGLRIMDPLTRYFMGAVARITFGDTSRMNREVFSALHRSAKEARILFAGNLRWRPPVEDPAALLRSVTCPSLTVWGTKDKIIPVEALDFFTAHLPHGESALFHGAGHVPMLEVPQEFNETLLKFLNSNILPSR